MSVIFVKGARKFFEICKTRGIAVEAEICEAEAGNCLIQCDSYEEVIGEFQNYVEMDKHDDCEDYQYDLNLKAVGLDEDGNSYEFASTGYRFLTSREMLHLLESDKGAMYRLVQRRSILEHVPAEIIAELQDTSVWNRDCTKVLDLIPAGKDPEAHDLADVFDGEEGLKICGDAVCLAWVECWTLDDDGDCIAVDNVEAQKLDEI